MTDELEEMARNCKWDLGNEPPVGDPRNKDFIEADVKKIVDALRTLRSKTRKEDAEIAEKTKWESIENDSWGYSVKCLRTGCSAIAQAILKKEEEYKIKGESNV